MSLGDNCRSACLSRDHDGFGACARSARIQVDEMSLTQVGKEADKAKDQTLERFRQCAAGGVTPRSPLKKDVVVAERLADAGFRGAVDQIGSNA